MQRTATGKIKMNFRRGSGVTIQGWVLIGSSGAAAQHTTFADIVTIGQSVTTYAGDSFAVMLHELIVTTAASGAYDFTFRWAAQAGGGSATIRSTRAPTWSPRSSPDPPPPPSASTRPR
jgi:hypothetical protein